MVTAAQVGPMSKDQEFWTLDAVLEATGGQLLVQGGEQSFSEISTDSRTLDRGDLFVALTGEQFDGHQFFEQAVSRGAAGVVVALEEQETIGLQGSRSL